MQARDIGAVITGGTSDYYYDPCLGQHRCKLGMFVDDNQRLIWQGQLLELRNRSLLYFGPYDPDAQRQQYADAVLRYWNGGGPGSAGYETWDRGPDITRELVGNRMVQEQYDDLLSGEFGWGRYWALVAPGVFHRGPIERGMLDAQVNRLENFGAVAPQNWRHLHPWGELRTAEEIGRTDDGVYWIAFDTSTPPELVSISVDALGDDLADIGWQWGLHGNDNWVWTWRAHNQAAGWILFARVMHAIGAAHLAAFPVTSQWAAPAYAAGNALIDMGAAAYYGDPDWADSLKALMDAGAQMYDIGMEGLEDAEKPPESEADKAKMDNNVALDSSGQVVGGNYQNENKTANAGKAGDDEDAQTTYEWTMASAEASDAAVVGDWEGVAEAFENHGFDLPPEFYEETWETLALITGFSDVPWGGTGVTGTAGPAATTVQRPSRGFETLTVSSKLKPVDRPGPRAGSAMTAAAMRAATGDAELDFGTAPGSANTAVVLGVLALILGLAWVM
jgi:hypothetical protein